MLLDWALILLAVGIMAAVFREQRNPPLVLLLLAAFLLIVLLIGIGFHP